jgi:hypothetical protein
MLLSRVPLTWVVGFDSLSAFVELSIYNRLDWPTCQIQSYRQGTKRK